ncbi:MAG: hypothetical protein KDK90_24450 [Leptospiraceae bacterium]|nr:hypothetical protein [Leptospiraceae bacterium]
MYKIKLLNHVGMFLLISWNLNCITSGYAGMTKQEFQKSPEKYAMFHIAGGMIISVDGEECYKPGFFSGGICENVYLTPGQHSIGVAWEPVSGGHIEARIVDYNFKHGVSYQYRCDYGIAFTGVKYCADGKRKIDPIGNTTDKSCFY